MKFVLQMIENIMRKEENVVTTFSIFLDNVLTHSLTMTPFDASRKQAF